MAAASGLAAAGPVATAAHSVSGAHTAGSGTAAAISQFAQSVGASHAPGNLSVPTAKPAARSVAHALDGHSHTRGITGKLPVSQ
jgi:hypothetical protein